MAERSEFFIHVDDEPKNLYISRPERIKSDALSPCCMTPDDVDYEMEKGKNPEILQICGMNQESLEYFVEKYGKTYRYLNFFKCQLISDFSPLEDLINLERVDIYWNIRTDRLWNFGKNSNLNTLMVRDCKKLTFNPSPLQSSHTLQEVYFCGSPFNNTPMQSLDCFSDIPALKTLYLTRIRLLDKNISFLDTLPNLEIFDFDAGMFTTEEIAYMCARYPELQGRSLKAYNKEDAVLNDVRVCGFRKPGLDLPQHQKRLDKYIAQFDALVEKYRKELAEQK